MYVDLLEPVKDLDISLDSLQSTLGVLYPESWEANSRKLYKRPFNLNINAFSNMWFNGAVKIFVAYDDKHEAVGFLIGMAFRPLPYDAFIFQVEDWYARGDAAIEKALWDFMTNAIRFMGCDEIRVGLTDDMTVPLPATSPWKADGQFTIRRFTKG